MKSMTSYAVFHGLKLRVRYIGRGREEIVLLSLNLVVVFARYKWIQIFRRIVRVL